MHANPDAEQYVLGCILMDDTLLRETELLPEHFCIGRHVDMFRCMRELSAQGNRVDFLSVRDNDLARDLYQAIPSITLFRHYETLVMDAWKRRKAVAIVESMKTDLAETQDLLHITNAIRELTQIEEVGCETEYNFAERVMAVVEELEHDTGEMKGVSTGFRDLNAYLHGWHDEDLIILAARPSVGKTALALHSLLHAARLGTACTLFAFEMRDSSNIRRMLSAHGEIDATKMRTPKKFFDKADWERLSRSASDMAGMTVAIYDKPNVTVAEMRTKVRSMKNRHPDKRHLVVIDYLQLMRGSNPRDKKVDQFGEISRDLKLMAREFKVPVILLSQLNRGVEQRQDKRPMMSDIRDSGNIEQDADVILMLYRDDYYNPESVKKNVVEVIIGKQRNGKTGTVELVFLKEQNRFVDLAREAK
jgi:replicative DNA helicase